MSGKGATVRELERRENQRRVTREELIRKRHTTQDFYIEALGGWVTIKTVSLDERDEINAACGWGTDKFDQTMYAAMSVVKSLVDPQLTMDDVAALREQDATLIDEINVYVTQLNLIGRAKELKREDSSGLGAEVPDGPGGEAGDDPGVTRIGDDLGGARAVDGESVGGDG